MKTNASIYDLNGRPPLGKAFPVGMQHMLALMVGNVTPIILIAATLGFDNFQVSFLIQCSLLVAGVVTIFQLYSFGVVGSKLPIMMGTSFTYLAIAISIGGKFGMSGIIGAVLIGAIFQILLGFCITRIKKFFPPLVTGCVVLCLGLTLIPVGIEYFAGGVGSANYGSLNNLLVGSVTLFTIVFLQFFTKGITNIAAILIGICGGYILAVCLGMVNFDTVANAAWFSFPKPLSYGVSFQLEAIIPMAIICLITSVQSIGNLSAVAFSGLKREVTGKELRGGLLAEGLGSAFCALFNAIPTTSYAQNVGIVSITKAVNRFSLLLGALFLVICGFVPKLAALFVAMPPAVLGGAAILLFSTVAVTGMQMIGSERGFDNRTTIIAALSIGLGAGFFFCPDIFVGYPEWISILLTSGLPLATVIAFVLNIVIKPKEK